MKTHSLLRELSQRDIRVAPRGNRLVIDAPKGAVTTELREILRAHKTELLDVLRRPPPGHADDSDAAERRAIQEVEAGAPVDASFAFGHNVDGRSDAPRWVTGSTLAGLPEPVQGLVCRRDGWTAGTWAAYLRTKADRCETRHPDAAARYRLAVRLLCGRNESFTEKS